MTHNGQDKQEPVSRLHITFFIESPFYIEAPQLCLLYSLVSKAGLTNPIMSLAAWHVVTVGCMLGLSSLGSVCIEGCGDGIESPF